MKVRYKKIWPIVMLVLGSINLIFGLLSLKAGGGAVMPMIASVITIVAGLLTLRGPLCIFKDKRTIIIPALLGPAKRVYEFESLDQLSMRNGKIFITTDGKSKRIPVFRFMANTDDWSLLIQELSLSDNV